MYMLILVTTDL